MHPGCDQLLFAIQRRVRPKFHVFGHVHEGRHMTCLAYSSVVWTSAVTDSSATTVLCKSTCLLLLTY